MKKIIVIILLSYIFIISNSCSRPKSNKELINSFIIANEAIERTNANFGIQLFALYENFRCAYIANKFSVGPYWERAQKAKAYSEALRNYINSQKNLLISKVEDITLKQAKETAVINFKKLNDYNITTKFFIGNSQKEDDAKGGELKNKIIEYKKNMLALLDSREVKEIKPALFVDSHYKDEDGNKTNWQMHYFNHTYLIAAITILNSLDAEISNFEYNIVSQIYTAISITKLSYGKIEAIVVPVSNYVRYGEQYKAEIFVAAYDTFSTFKAEINGKAVKAEKGKILYQTTAKTLGLQKYSGNINVQTPFGTKSYPFKGEYTVEKGK